MSIQILLILIFNFIITLIGTLAYSTRLVGVRTGKIAISFTVFNILTLISRTAVTFQEPLLTNYAEKNLYSSNLLNVFNIIILVSGIASVLGVILIPTFQRMFSKGVLFFSVEKSIPKLIVHSITRRGIKSMKQCAVLPSKESVKKIDYRRLPRKIVLYNFISVAVLTVGALAPIYAFKMVPNLRATCVTLSSVVNGIAQILMTIFIDPAMSIMTEEVIEKKCREEDFKNCVTAMALSKVAGTFAAIILLIPASFIIVYAAKGVDFISRI
ncbi:lipid II flippase Amj family protein [Clostridium felsineum]|uniref:lipid II flippase Amj family protein n=1 Tax=Clostridium felsineum TaxID=36839 RepID=UPI00098CE3AD|nr:lipid II flippase Amj family protein [Clostridium felsineum]URZ02174.1 Lipid II flippase Amj [Clostridium felsineum]